MQKYFDYLDQLRQSGETNMFGAVPYLQKKFPELSFDAERAQKILTAWMSSFGQPHTRAEDYSSGTEAGVLFLFGDFMDDLAAHLAEKDTEAKCLCCAYHKAGHKCGNFLFCTGGIQRYLLECTAQYCERMESSCKTYFEYLDHLNNIGAYDQYTAETALKTEFPYLADHEEYAKYVMALWMLQNRN